MGNDSVFFCIYNHGTDEAVSEPMLFYRCVIGSYKMLSDTCDDELITFSDFSKWDEIVNVGTTLDADLPEQTTSWWFDIRPAGYATKEPS